MDSHPQKTPSLPDLSRYKQGERFVKTRDWRRDPAYRWKLIPRWRTSKARREQRSYELMRQIGIPCPDGVEIREERTLLGLQLWSEISMPFLPDTADLRFICLLDEYAHLRANPTWRRAMIDELARLTRLMHQHHFYALNLHFRNWLVDLTAPIDQPHVYLIDCVSGQIAKLPANQQRLRLKDLAFIYRDSRVHASPRERLRFFHHYLGRNKLTHADRQLMAQIATYTQQKWGDKTSGIS